MATQQILKRAIGEQFFNRLFVELDWGNPLFSSLGSRLTPKRLILLL